MFRRPLRRRMIGRGMMGRGMMRRRFMWRRAPYGRFGLMQTGMLFMMGAAAYKITQADADQIQQTTGRDFSQMTEADLLDAMKRLGIQQLSLDDDDRNAIAGADKV